MKFTTQLQDVAKLLLKGVDFETAYGTVMRNDAKRYGHKGVMPPSPQPERSCGDLQNAILDLVKSKTLTTTGIKTEVKTSQKIAENVLYRMRAAGLVHSVNQGRTVVWHIGAKDAAAVGFKSRRAAA